MPTQKRTTLCNNLKYNGVILWGENKSHPTMLRLLSHNSSRNGCKVTLIKEKMYFPLQVSEGFSLSKERELLAAVRVRLKNAMLDSKGQLSLLHYVL